jgi:hypothetical protein
MPSAAARGMSRGCTRAGCWGCPAGPVLRCRAAWRRASPGGRARAGRRPRSNWGNGRDGAMRHNEDRNLLKIRILERAPQHSIPCGGGHASEIQLVANQYVSKCHVRLLRPILPSLPLAFITSPAPSPPTASSGPDADRLTTSVSSRALSRSVLVSYNHPLWPTTCQRGIPLAENSKLGGYREDVAKQASHKAPHQVYWWHDA